MGSCLVGRSQKRCNWPVEVCFFGLNDLTLVGSATMCSILKLSWDLFRWYIVLYFLPKTPHTPDSHRTLRETWPLSTFDFGKRAIKVCKCDGKVTFTIPFQDIYPFIKGDLAQHQERSCKGDLSITFTIPWWLSFQIFKVIKGLFSRSGRIVKDYRPKTGTDYEILRESV